MDGLTPGDYQDLLSACQPTNQPADLHAPAATPTRPCLHARADRPWPCADRLSFDDGLWAKFLFNRYSQHKFNGNDPACVRVDGACLWREQELRSSLPVQPNVLSGVQWDQPTAHCDALTARLS